jgi:hypothetical protein
MSYSAFGNDVGATCARMQTMMPGTGTYMPGQICGERPGQTGDHPPRPRICGGIGIMDVQNGLKLAGLYHGPVDGKQVTAELLALLSQIAAAYNVPWDGDLWTVGPNLCGAIIAEVSKKAPSCSPAYGIERYETGCVAKPTGPLMEPLPGAGPPPPAPSVSPLMSRAALLRRVQAPKPQIVAARDTLQRAVTTTEADVSAPAPADVPAPAPAAEGVPTWVYVAGGAVVLGGVA